MPIASAQSCTLLRVARRASRINTPSFFVRIVICDFISMNPLEYLIDRAESNDFPGPRAAPERAMHTKGVRSVVSIPKSGPSHFACSVQALTPNYLIIAEALESYRR